MNETSKNRRSVWWPWVIFVVGTLILDLSFHALSVTNNRGWGFLFGKFAIASIWGILSGEFCLVIVICGLCGRHWLGGYAAASGLAILGWLALVAGQFFYTLWIDKYANWEFFASTFVGPTVLLFSSTTLYAFRSFRGWRLTRQLKLPGRKSISIADMMISTAFVAAMLTLIRVTIYFLDWTMVDLLTTVAIISGTFCSVSLVAIAPTIRMLFRDDYPSVLGLSAVCALECLIACGIFLQLNRLSSAPLPTHIVIALTVNWVGLAFGYTITGFALLRLTGFRLHTRSEYQKAEVECRRQTEASEIESRSSCTR